MELSRTLADTGTFHPEAPISPKLMKLISCPGSLPESFQVHVVLCFLGVEGSAWAFLIVV